MEKIAILFPGDEALKEPLPEFAEEFAICSKLNLFDCVLYHRQDTDKRKELAVSARGATKSQYCIMRGLDYSVFDRDILEHALKRCGYKPIYYDSWLCNDRIDRYLDCRFDHGNYIPKRIKPYHRHFECDSSTPRWFPDCVSGEFKTPMVAKDNNSVLRNDDGSIRLIVGEFDGEEIDGIILSFDKKGADFYTDRYCEAPMLFEEHLNIAEVGGVKVEWCIFCCLGKIFYASPKFPVRVDRELPRPPEDLLRALEDYDFLATDVALTVDKGWKITRRVRGEISNVPLGGNVKEFYQAFHTALMTEEDVPEWIWSPVAYIVNEHTLGQKQVKAKWTLHFSAGTKVYITDAYWGQCADRCTVLGIPKYSNYVIGVAISTDLLDHFELEKVTDRDVIRAMWTNRLQERYERHRETCLRTTYWGDSDREKEMALRFVNFIKQERAEDEVGTGS